MARRIVGVNSGEFMERSPEKLRDEYPKNFPEELHKKYPEEFQEKSSNEFLDEFLEKCLEQILEDLEKNFRLISTTISEGFPKNTLAVLQTCSDEFIEGNWRNSSKKLEMISKKNFRKEVPR